MFNRCFPPADGSPRHWEIDRINHFAHALPFLEQDANFVIGCVLPDWLRAVDRRSRIRKKNASMFLTAADPLVSGLAGGMLQHIDDDRWFHTGSEFNKLNMVFALELRELLTGETGFRPGFLGHILIELLLDGYLSEAFPQQLDQFYSIVAASDPASIQSAVNRIATRPTDRLSAFFPVFLRERYLFDYVDNAKLTYRVNRVLLRVNLNQVSDELVDWIPTARNRVYVAATELLGGFSQWSA